MNPIKSLANYLLESNVLNDPATAVLAAGVVSIIALIAIAAVPVGILYLITESKK